MEAYQARVNLQADAALPPVLYLLDRNASDAFWPDSTHSWAVVDVGEIWSDVPGSDRLRHPMCRAFLISQRTMLLMIGHPDLQQRRIGLVGEGRGGAVALALAALLPDQVAFVAAHQPVDPIGTSEAAMMLQEKERAESSSLASCFSLTSFAGLIRCPALLSWGSKDALAPPEDVIAVYDSLACDKTGMELAWASHCQPKDLGVFSKAWREWTRGKLGEQHAAVRADGCGDGARSSMLTIPASASFTSP